MIKRLISLAVAALATLLAAPAAMATSNCTATVFQVYTDASSITILPNNAPQIVIPVAADGSAQRAYAAAMLAAVSGKTVTIFYAANGVSCTGGTSRNDYVAMIVNF